MGLEKDDEMKRILKFSVLVIVLGVCAIYTYGFITGDDTGIQTEEDAVEGEQAEEQTEEIVNEDKPYAAVYQTPSPEKLNSIEDGWERVKYGYLPNLPDLKWVEINEEYLLVMENVSYKVVGASIGKKWNPAWNFDVMKDHYTYEDYTFDKNHNLKSKDSFVSVHIQMENKGKKTCSCCLSTNDVQVYNAKGKNVDIGILCTMSIDKPPSQTVYFEKLKPGGKLDVELVYIMKDKHLADTNYYFLSVVPGNSYPPNTDWVGIFKLPFGVEGGNQNDTE